MTELDEDYLFPPDVYEIEDEKEEWLWKTAVIAGRQLRTTYRWT